MTNADIIRFETMELFKQGKIKGTGQFVEDAEGNSIEIPEAIHTYAKWKTLGYQVIKGQHAVAKFKIWKHKVKKAKAEGEQDEEQLFMVESSFFSASQVERV